SGASEPSARRAPCAPHWRPRSIRRARAGRRRARRAEPDVSVEELSEELSTDSSDDEAVNQSWLVFEGRLEFWADVDDFEVRQGGRKVYRHSLDRFSRLGARTHSIRQSGSISAVPASSTGR